MFRHPGARGSGIKKVSRYRGNIIELLVASLLAAANRHCVLVRLSCYRGREASPRPGLQQYHAQTDSVGVPEPGITERTLALRLPDAVASLVAHRRTSRQASARFCPRPMTDLPALPPLHSIPRPLSDETRSRCIRSAGRKLARHSGTARALPNHLSIPQQAWYVSNMTTTHTTTVGSRRRISAPLPVHLLANSAHDHCGLNVGDVESNDLDRRASATTLVLEEILEETGFLKHGLNE